MGAHESTNIELLGARIKRLRMERKLAQDRLAIEARVDQSGLSKFERGKDRGMGEMPLRRISAVLKVPFEELIAGTDYQLR
jgi:transcriptional regulator with XRE-family HTH domain